MQWKDKIINTQHIFNETILYLLSVILLMFSNYLSGDMRYIMGFILIFVVFVFVVYNMIIMLVFSFKILIVVVRKQYYKFKSKNLRKEIRKIIDHIQIKLDNKSKLQSNWFQPD